MTEEEPNSERDKADAMSPTVQLRLWRRVWVIVAVFVLLAPVMLWVVIDQAGKAEWREVQARLRAKGEATTIEELNLPTREEVPDEDNFCAIPWLMANDDGTESVAMEALQQRLSIFSGAGADSLLLRKAKGKPLLGFQGDLDVFVKSVELTAEKQAIPAPALAAASAESEAAGILAAYLQLFDDEFSQLAAAVNRPQAVFLPTYRKKLKNENGNPSTIQLPNSYVVSALSSALRARVLVGLQQGDFETVIQSLQINLRLIEPFDSEPTLLSGLVCMGILFKVEKQVVDCLWNESLRRDESALKRISELLQGVDCLKVSERMVRGELVYFSEMMQWRPENRGSFVVPAGSLFPDGGSLWLRIVPTGWYHANAAFSAELIDATLLTAFRSGKYAELLRESNRMQNVMSRQSKPERLYYSLCTMASSYYKYVVSGAYLEAYHRQAIIACALYRYRLANAGKFPVALEALVPKFLAAVPEDPIDGAPMRYSTTDSGSFLLYSIAYDGSDDGGILNLDPHRMGRTSVISVKGGYLGDWPWPVEPREQSVLGMYEE